MCRQDLRYCNRTQVQLPTPWKTSTGEAGADIKQSGFIQGPVTWKMGDSYLKAHLIISAILTSLYRGTMGRGEVRNFWLRAVSEFCSLVVSMLSSVRVFMQFHRPYLETGHAGGISAGSDLSH